MCYCAKDSATSITLFFFWSTPVEPTGGILVSQPLVGVEHAPMGSRVRPSLRLQGLPSVL